MPATRRETIRKLALDLINAPPSGLRYSELVRLVHEAHPDIPINTINGNVWNLEAVLPDAIYKPARGVFRALKFREREGEEPPAPRKPEIEPTAPVLTEEAFYEPFADWITKELEECTKAISLGGNRFRDKWGTPDVIGIREPRKIDIITEGRAVPRRSARPACAELAGGARQAPFAIRWKKSVASKACARLSM